MNEQQQNQVEQEDEGRPLNFRQQAEAQASNDPAQFAGQFADQFLTKNFAKRWAAMLWGTMRQTGNGYRKYSMKNTGRGLDRRSDKLDADRSPTFRRYQERYASVAQQ